MVNYQPKGLMALFTGFKNQLMRINADNGSVVWEATYRGVVEKEILTRDPLVTLSIHGDKLFLQLGGLQVFNLANGENLWGAHYEPDMGGVKYSGGGKILPPEFMGPSRNP
jgi:outer membrane protein assembly factor BamB